MLQLIAGNPDSFGITTDPTAWPDYSPAAAAEFQKMLQGYADRLDRYDPIALSEQDALTYNVLLRYLDSAFEGERYQGYLINYSMINLLQLQPNIVSYYIIADADDAVAYTESFKRYPALLDGLIASIEASRTDDIPFTEAFLDAYLVQLRDLRHRDPMEDPYFLRLQEWIGQSNGNPADEQRIADELKHTLTHVVYPSLEIYEDYIRDELLPESVDEISLSALPGGSEFYAFLLRDMLGTDMTPEQVHAYAEGRVAALAQELNRVPLAQRYLFDSTPRVFTDEAVQRAAGLQAELAERLPDVFEPSILPDASLRYLETDFPFSMYRYVSIDDSRDGTVLYSKDQRFNEFYYRVLSYHEGLPGHHLQLAVQFRSDIIPNVRKIISHGAFVEGWATYAESIIGDELGLYGESGDDVGQLLRELTQFAEIVLDTGIHGMGWTQAEVDEFMREYFGGGTVYLRAYGFMPGQIVMYGMGFEQFRILRERAEDELGDAFDVRTFHTAVLENGSLPFELLERQVERYIERTKNS